MGGQQYEMSDSERGLCCYFGEVDRPEWTRDAGSGEEFKRHGRGRKGAPDREVKVEKVGISRHSIFGILILSRNERSQRPDKRSAAADKHDIDLWQPGLDQVTNGLQSIGKLRLEFWN